MKELCINTLNNPTRKTKHLSVSQYADDKECKTYVQKSFIYKAFRVEKTNPQLNPPQIYIKKVFNTKNKVEGFTFKVKGSFYLTYKRFLYKVRFHHILNIEIVWKTQIFSPKKSAVLT